MVGKMEMIWRNLAYERTVNWIDLTHKNDDEIVNKK